MSHVKAPRGSKALEQSQLLFHTLLLLFEKSIGKNQLMTKDNIYKNFERQQKFNQPRFLPNYKLPADYLRWEN